MDRSTAISRILRKSGTPILPLRWATILDEIVANCTDPADQTAQEHLRDLQFFIEKDGRIRSNWHPSGKHGRLYSSSPNIQGMHGKLRECVGWRGMAVVTFDLASAHVAIAANLAGDQPLADAISAAKAGQDFYQHLADQAGVDRAVLKVALLAYLNGASDPETVLPEIKALFAEGGPYVLTGSWIRMVQEQARSKGRFSALGRVYELDAEEQRRCHTAPSKAFQHIEFEILAGAAAKLHDSKVCEQAQLIVFLHDELVYLIPAPDTATLKNTIGTLQRALIQNMMSVAKDMNIVLTPELKPAVGSTWRKCKTEGEIPRGKEQGKVDARNALLDRVVEEAAKNFSVTPLDAQFFAKKRIADWDAEPILPTDMGSDQLEARYCATLFAMENMVEFDLAVGAIGKGPNAVTTKNTLKTLKTSAKALNKKKGRFQTEPEPEEVWAGSDSIRTGGFERGDEAEMASKLVEGLKNKFEDAVFDPAIGFHGLGHRSKVWEKVPESWISQRMQEWSGSRVGEAKELLISAGKIEGSTKLAADLLTPPGEEGFFATPPNGIVFKDGSVLGIEEARSNLPPRTALPNERVRSGDTVDFDFDPDATAPRFEQFLQEIWGDDLDFEEKKTFLLEWVGATMFGQATKYQKAIALIGHRGSGKGVLLSTILGLFSENHCTNADLKSLAGPDGQKHIAQIYGKKVVSNPDMGKKYVEDTSLIKAAISGEKVKGRVLYKDLFDFRPTAGWIFALDGDVQLPSAEDGIYRRVVNLRHNNKFVADPDEEAKKQHPGLAKINYRAEDPHLQPLLLAEKPGILNMVVEAFRNLDARKRMLVPTSSKVEAELSQQDSDTVRAWHETFCAVGEDGVWPPLAERPSSDFYVHYRQFCIDRGHSPKNEVHFGKGLNSISPGYANKNKKTDGKVIKVRTIPHRILGGKSELEEAVENMVVEATASDLKKLFFASPSQEEGFISNELQTRNEDPVDPMTAEVFASSIVAMLHRVADQLASGAVLEASRTGTMIQALRHRETYFTLATGELIDLTTYLERRLAGASNKAGSARTSAQAAEMDQ